MSSHTLANAAGISPGTLRNAERGRHRISRQTAKRLMQEIANRDAMLIHPMAYVTLTIDHRVVDGHQTNAWLTRFVQILENWPAA